MFSVYLTLPDASRHVATFPRLSDAVLLAIDRSKRGQETYTVQRGDEDVKIVAQYRNGRLLSYQGTVTP